MRFSGSGPGKTAPKLFHDFLLFDPLKASGKSNYLTDVSTPKDEGVSVAPGIGSCRHEYTTKHCQSVIPPLDLRPDDRTEFKSAVVCKKCRLHADVHIRFASATNPCPNSDYPLHHFLRVPTQDTQGHDRIVYGWQCSAPECSSQLRITFRRPRLETEQRRQLTDTELLKRRYEAVIQDDPNREGIRLATPIDALTRLRKYIKDALNTEHTRRTFPANNKRFMEAFGVYGRDCEGLLCDLGFKASRDAEGFPQWSLPQPPAIVDRLRADGTSAREMLEDVEMELLAYMSQLANEMAVVNPASGEGWHAADRDVERTLAAQGYQRHSAPRRTAVSNEQLPYFDSLGVLPGFADSLIEFAFDRQSFCDPERRPYYFECLQAITDRRGTERLQMKVATLESDGAVSRREIIASCKQLGLQYSEAATASEDRILNVFHAQQSDLGQQAQEESRQALNKLGLYRGSQRLINASQQTIETYEEALAWLGSGVTKATPDDSLLAIATTKQIDASAEVTKKAISVIAKERRSNMLNSWLLTGQADGGGYQMSVDEALRHLNIEQGLGMSDLHLDVSEPRNRITTEREMPADIALVLDSLDPSVLPAVFESARIDRPGEQTDKAIAAIEQALAGTDNTHSPETWPVGLTSHGNTCYLNSLLQYYFAIKPLRDIVLDYDKYKLDIDTFSEKAERVGYRQITQVEIKGGQKFAEDLKHLFERMIKEPGTQVKPEEDLVCRTFLEPKDYALLVSAAKEELVQRDEATNLPNAVDETITEDFANTNTTRQESDASSVTLKGSVSGDVDVPMTDGEPSFEVPAQDEHDANENDKATQAPPLPPRRFSTAKEEALAKAQANAKQQQDATEAHDAMQFRLRSGMTPDGKDVRNEQDDVLHRLFKHVVVETHVKDGQVTKQEELEDTHLLLNVPYQNIDVYSALDAVFDLQTANETGFETYKSIRTMPPLLQLNIPRIGFEKDGRGTFKPDTVFRLEDELFLDRYVDSSDPRVLPARRNCWGWRRQLHTLRKELTAISKTETGIDGPTTIAETANYLSHLTNVNDELKALGIEEMTLDETLPAALSAEAISQNKRLSALDIEIKDLENRLKNQFSDMKKIKYRLAAVFFHRGNHGHGHYWIYIHDFANDMWRLYNDEKVEHFTNLKEIFEAEGFSQGTPTYAVYVMDSIKDEIIQPVCREPEKVSTLEPSDLQDNYAWENETHMNGGSDGLPPPLIPVDSRLTVHESAGDWDAQRSVPDGNW